MCFHYLTALLNKRVFSKCASFDKTARKRSEHSTVVHRLILLVLLGIVRPVSSVGLADESLSIRYETLTPLNESDYGVWIRDGPEYRLPGVTSFQIDCHASLNGESFDYASLEIKGRHWLAPTLALASVPIETSIVGAPIGFDASDIVDIGSLATKLY